MSYISSSGLAAAVSPKTFCNVCPVLILRRKQQTKLKGSIFCWLHNVDKHCRIPNVIFSTLICTHTHWTSAAAAKLCELTTQTRAAAPKKNCLNRENLQPQKRPIKDPFEGLQRPRGRAAEPLYHRSSKVSKFSVFLFIVILVIFDVLSQNNF